jgi:hypothetical protein
VQLVDAQPHRFAHPQAVPVHEKNEQRITLAVPAAACGRDQELVLAFAQEVLFALVRINGI